MRKWQLLCLVIALILTSCASQTQYFQGPCPTWTKLDAQCSGIVSVFSGQGLYELSTGTIALLRIEGGKANITAPHNVQFSRVDGTPIDPLTEKVNGAVVITLVDSTKGGNFHLQKGDPNDAEITGTFERRWEIR